MMICHCHCGAVRAKRRRIVAWSVSSKRKPCFVMVRCESAANFRAENVYFCPFWDLQNGHFSLYTREECPNGDGFVTRCVSQFRRSLQTAELNSAGRTYCQSVFRG